MIGDTIVGKNSSILEAVDSSKSSSNHFVVLSSYEALKKGKCSNPTGMRWILK